ncbi:hypothetical protein DRP04_15530, partial [Archaeoglobales archaeon]
MNIKKIIAGSLATLTAGATLAFGALGLLVEDTTPPYIVIGADAQVIDTIAAADLAAYMASEVTEEVAVGGGATTTVTNGYLFGSKGEKNQPYLGKSLNTIRSKIVNSDIPNLLTSGTIDIEGKEITYSQYLSVGSHKVEFKRPSSDYTEPTLFVKFPTDVKYNLTLTFSPAFNASKLTSSDKINILGTEYTFSAAEQTNSSWELFTSSGVETVTLQGTTEEKTVTIGGESYKFKINSYTIVGEKTCIYFIINDVAVGDCWVAGQYYPIPGTSQKVYVKSAEVVYVDPQTGMPKATLFLGSQKLVLEHGKEVEVNDESLDNTKVYFDGTGGLVSKVTIEIAPEEETFLTDGNYFQDPIFSNLRWYLSGMTPALTDESRDKAVIEKDGDYIVLTFKNKDGMEFSQKIFYWNDSAWVSRVDTSHEIWTREANSTSNFNVSKKDYVVLTCGDKTYIAQYKDYDTSDKTVTFEIAGSEIEVNYETNPVLFIGGNEFKIHFNSGDKTLYVDLNCDGKFLNTTYVNITTATGALIDITNPGLAVFYEDPLYKVPGSNDPSGKSIVFNASRSGDTTYLKVKAEGNDIRTTDYQISDEDKWKYVTEYGTYLYATGSDDKIHKVEIYYPGNRPAKANVA